MLSSGIYCVYVECDFLYPGKIDEFTLAIHALDSIDILEVE